MEKKNVVTGTELGEDGEPINVTTTGSSSDTSFQSNVYTTVFHPKILGFLVLMLIAVFAMVFLARKQS